VGDDVREALAQVLAKPIREHKIEDVVQQFGEIRADCASKHADALEYGFLLRRILLATYIPGTF
jgi:hypothetical protein